MGEGETGRSEADTNGADWKKNSDGAEAPIFSTRCRVDQLRTHARYYLAIGCISILGGAPDHELSLRNDDGIGVVAVFLTRGLLT